MAMSDEIEHSERGPSGAQRWRNCKASVLESRGLPDTAGIYAAEGTAFHDFAADCLELGIDPHQMLGATKAVPGFGTFTLDRVMANHMQVGIDLVMAFASEPGAKMIVEQKVPLDEWVGPGEIGTMDVGILNVWKRRIVTFDWKYGAGVPVSPIWNDQGILYTLGLWSKWGREAFAGLDPAEIEVVIIIEQPRAPGGGGVWTTTMDMLLREGKLIRKDADDTLKPDAPYQPSVETCKFCKAAQHNTCKVRAAFVLDSVGAKFDTLDVDEPLTFTPTRALAPEVRSQLLLNRKMIEDYLHQLHDEAMADAAKGEPVPGLKRVLGRSPARKWQDPAKAAILLERQFFDDAYTLKLLSPSQAQDMIGKARFNERFSRLVANGEPSPILVPEDDKRPALRDVHDKFDSLIDDNPLI